MKKLLLIGVAAVAFLIGIADAQSINTTEPPSSMVRGTATNDGAPAGNIGEYVVSGLAQSNSVFANATVTISIASPAVISWTGNPYFLASAPGNGCASLVSFGTSGSLPTGITAGTPFYVTCDASLTANAFHISTSVANAIAGTAVNTSGTQSGTQTGQAQAVLTTNTPVDYGGLSLTAGDWEVSGVAVFSPGATTSVTMSQSRVSTGSGITGTGYANALARQAAEVPAAAYLLPMSTERVSLTSTTTLFCSFNSVFTVSTMTADGFCWARRRR